MATRTKINLGEQAKGQLPAENIGQHKSKHESGGEDALTGFLDANARVEVLKEGIPVGKRRRLDFEQGTGTTLTITEDEANEKIIIRISMTGVQTSWIKEYKDDWDGVQNQWVLSYTPIDDNHLAVYRNGLFLRPGPNYDYVLNGNKIIFNFPPKPGDVTAVHYQYIS